MTAGTRLLVDPIACDGRGLCAEILPELITLDDWGFPIIRDGDVSGRLIAEAREAVRVCPSSPSGSKARLRQVYGPSSPRCRRPWAVAGQGLRCPRSGLSSCRAVTPSAAAGPAAAGAAPNAAAGAARNTARLRDRTAGEWGEFPRRTGVIVASDHNTVSVMSQAMNPLGVSRSRCIVDSDRERLAGHAARCRNPATRVPARAQGVQERRRPGRVAVKTNGPGGKAQRPHDFLMIGGLALGHAGTRGGRRHPDGPAPQARA